MNVTGFVWAHKKAVLLLLALACLYGAYAAGSLPVAIFPDLTAPRIIVTADAGDMPIPAVLANVTRPLENAVAGVPGVTRVHSLTQRGADELDVNFGWGTNMLTALQQVNTQLTQIQASLPAGVNVTAERLNPSVFPIMGYSLYSPTVSAETLRSLALYTLRPRLLRVPGVQQIAVLGGDTPDFRVMLDPTALLARGVTAQDVEDALAKSNQTGSVGYYDQSYLHYDILVSGLFHNASDIAGVTVAVKNRVPVTVGQLGTVAVGVEPRTIETSGDGHDAVLINVIKQPTGNTVQTAAGIREALASVRREMPPGIKISNFYDQSQIVQESQSSVLEAILVGGVLALIVLMLFLGNVRAAAVVLVILPLTILITFGMMKALGQTMNIMTLGALAIALGLVIDDGIVVVENIFQTLEQGYPRREAIAMGIRAMTPPMIGSSLTTMAAFLPLTFLNDLTGQFFGPLALVMISTLGVSLILALALTPLMGDWLLPEKITHHAAKPSAVSPFERLRGGYGHVLVWCLTHRAAVLLLLLPLAGGAWLLARHLQTGFFPEFDEGGFILDYQLPDGTSLAQSSATAAGIETVLAKTPEVAAWSRRTGAQLGFDITTQNVGDISVRLKNKRARGINAVMDDVRAQVESEYPAAQVDFHQILQDNIGDIAGSPSPVEIKIFGPDENELQTLAQQADGIITQVPGVVDDFNGIVHSTPEAVAEVNTGQAQRYGLTASDIAQAAQAALQGSVPTSVQQGEQSVPVRVILARASGSESNAAFLPNIPVASPVTGGDVPLGQIAHVSIQPGLLQPTREDQRNMIAVTADLSGRDLGSATADIQRRIARSLTLPTGYSIEYGGEYASQQQSFAALGTVLLIALLLVFTLLVAQMRSVRQAGALLAAALLSLFGVLAALTVTGTPLNISSFTGAIMIVGIITENGIVLFEFYNRLRHAQPGAATLTLLGEAGRARLRPILMTTLGAILALLPLALGLGAGAALQKPLAIAVIGGLCVSVFFTLLVAPVLFLSLERLGNLRLPRMPLKFTRRSKV